MLNVFWLFLRWMLMITCSLRIQPMHEWSVFPQNLNYGYYALDILICAKHAQALWPEEIPFVYSAWRQTLQDATIRVGTDCTAVAGIRASQFFVDSAVYRVGVEIYLSDSFHCSHIPWRVWVPYYAACEPIHFVWPVKLAWHASRASTFAAVSGYFSFTGLSRKASATRNLFKNMVWLKYAKSRADMLGYRLVCLHTRTDGFDDSRPCV